MAFYGALRNLLWRLVPPREVTEVRHLIREFLADTDPFFPPEIEREALALVNDIDRTVYTIREDKKKPDQLALMLIMNVLAQRLPSGMYHTYRGVLSGKGKSMLAVWHRSLKLLRERGYYTDEEADSDREWIREQIKGAG